MQKHRWLLGFALANLACAAAAPAPLASSARVADGLFAITCQGNRTNCYEEAGRACPEGFEVRDTNDQRGAVVQAQTTTNYFTKQTQVTAVERPTYSGDMLIECKRATPTTVATQTPAAPENWQETFPSAVAGYRFGAGTQQFADNCTASQATAVPGPSATTCPKGPSGLPFEVQNISGTFCAGQLCELVLRISGSQPTEARRVQALLEQKYGPAQAPAGFVSRCSTEDHAFTAFQRAWRWGDEFAAATITIAFDCPAPAGPPSIAVTYRDPKGETMRAREREDQQKNF